MRITHWKKMAVSAVVVAASVGAGAAWAQDTGTNGSNTATEQIPQADARMTGGGTTETKLIPIDPCRLVDTRAGAGKFANGTTRSFDVRGTGSTFAAQGGKANGCGIPDGGVSAVEITISAVDPGGKGFLRAFPRVAPAATFLSYTGGTDIGNTGTVALCGSDGGICLLNKDLSVKNFGSTTHVVIDVSGYYAQPLTAVVLGDGTVAHGSRNVSVHAFQTGEHDVIFDRNVSKCVYAATVGYPGAGQVQGYASASGRVTDVKGVFVETFDGAGNAADLPFHLTVTC